MYKYTICKIYKDFFYAQYAKYEVLQGQLDQFDGGGEKKGIAGIMVGMVGIDGIVVSNGGQWSGWQRRNNHLGICWQSWIWKGSDLGTWQWWQCGPQQSWQWSAKHWWQSGRDGIVGSVNAGGGQRQCYN